MLKVILEFAMLVFFLPDLESGVSSSAHAMLGKQNTEERDMNPRLRSLSRLVRYSSLERYGHV